MAKGAIAKQEVIKKLQSIFGNDFLGEFDKKIYVHIFKPFITLCSQSNEGLFHRKD